MALTRVGAGRNLTIIIYSSATCLKQNYIYSCDIPNERDSSSGDSRSVRPGRRFRFRLSKGDVGRISDTIYDIAVRGIGGAAAVEGG